MIRKRERYCKVKETLLLHLMSTLNINCFVLMEGIVFRGCLRHFTIVYVYIPEDNTILVKQKQASLVYMGYHKFLAIYCLNFFYKLA